MPWTTSSWKVVRLTLISLNRRVKAVVEDVGVVVVVEIVDVVEVVSVVAMMEVVVVGVEVVSEVAVEGDMEVEMVDTEVDEEEVVGEDMEVVVVVIEAVTVDGEVTAETKVVMVVAVKVMEEAVMVNSREEITTVKAVMEVVLEVDTVVLHLLHPRTELLQPNHHTTHTEVPQALQAPQPISHLEVMRNPRVTTALVANKATGKVSNKAMDKDSNNRATARVNNKATINNRVTAVPHSNQQHQHLQVTLKGTTNNNNNNNNPHMEVQGEVARTDINNKLDAVTDNNNREPFEPEYYKLVLITRNTQANS